MLAKIYLGNRFSQGSLSEVDKANIYNNLAGRLEAVYDTKIKTIYLGDRLDVQSVYGRSVIAHELVHFLQDVNQHRAKVECQNALEKDAYQLQVLYLKKTKFSACATKF
ncbi:hypothetical protein AB835_00825 [Candidatus Endobugula sertula]|uniref:DUF6647 domain-containing protein n=1 Tax=Candidatus Endobugula sertula TaxID=62101 RepID=A0A1D2QU24_9GAMM|nr:hypothetical protein AB835_00825 [Candidatus Endobugula sertula]